MASSGPPLLADLQRGERLDEYVELVRRAARAVAWYGNLPHPEGRPWEPEDLDELVQEFFRTNRQTQIILRSPDEAALRRLTNRAMKNLVIDELRTTDRTKLHRRLLEILRDDFDEGPAKWWRLRGTPEGKTWSDRDESLVAAAWVAEGVRLVRWSPEAKRDGPLADRPSLVRVLTAVLRHAAAAVRISTLVAVVAHRFGVSSFPRIESIDAPIDRTTEHDVGELARVGDAATTGAGYDPEIATIAAEIWSTQLSPRERALLPYLAAGGRAVELELDIGLRRSAAHDALERLKEKMATLLGDLNDEERRGVVARLLQFQSGEDDL